MPREEKIKVIYETIANKERIFGCKYIIKDGDWHKYEVRETEWECVKLTYWDEYQVEYWDDYTRTNYLVSIIWHPVMIGDVLDRYRTNNNDYKVWEINPYDLKSYSAFQEYDIKRLLNLWTEKRTPIDEQSDECVDFVHSLIKKI